MYCRGIIGVLTERAGFTPDPEGNTPPPLSAGENDGTNQPSKSSTQPDRFSMRNLSPGPRWISYGGAIYVAGEVLKVDTRQTAVTIISLGTVEVIHRIFFPKGPKQ